MNDAAFFIKQKNNALEVTTRGEEGREDVLKMLCRAIIEDEEAMTLMVGAVSFLAHQGGQTELSTDIMALVDADLRCEDCKDEDEDDSCPCDCPNCN